ncbi:RxLR effector protein [Phytophthora megakarya]|uniref:RxLR effector protein n=1 Tax=Phytophthora megakarya TaxID=4795 RepID=A0A225UTS2_9STRA|nr:RxLR effector protein [Phytophthora megakarya]
MKKLGGGTLENHPNYAYFKKFQYEAEGHKLDEMVRGEIPTQEVWMKLGLETMTDVQRMRSDDYRFYVRYATKYDDVLWLSRNTIFQPTIYYGGSKAEMEAKVKIWVTAKRSRGYVEEVLGLDELPAGRLRTQSEFYLQRFLNQIKNTESKLIP